jgi:hypothetical protein
MTTTVFRPLAPFLAPLIVLPFHDPKKYYSYKWEQEACHTSPRAWASSEDMLKTRLREIRALWEPQAELVSLYVFVGIYRKKPQKSLVIYWVRYAIRGEKTLSG